MKHYQYYFTNPVIERPGNHWANTSKIFIDYTHHSLRDSLNWISLTNNSIIDIYIFGFSMNGKLYNEFNSKFRVEDLCVGIDKECVAQNIDRSSIKLNILYISQLRNYKQYNSIDLTDERVDDIFNYVQPYYASIVKILVEDSKEDHLNKFFSRAYHQISEPLTKDVCANLVKDMGINLINGIYYSPNFQGSDALPLYCIENAVPTTTDKLEK